MIIKEASEEIGAYLEDSSNFQKGSAQKLFIPESEAEVVAILTECSQKKMPVTISGGGTGTVAGRIPQGGAILSTERLNRIITIDPQKKRAVLQGGVIVDQFLNEIEKEGLFYPPFPTERSAYIAGNVATNASGEYSYRFGATRKYIRRLRFVLSDGEVVDISRSATQANAEGVLSIGSRLVKIPTYRTPALKCAAGYYAAPKMDGVDLLIGSEGTLAVFTEVEVDLIPSLPERMIMVFFFSAGADLFGFLSAARNPKLSALSLEYFDRHSLDFLRADFPDIPAKADFAFYIEAPTETLEDWLSLLEDRPVLDTWAGADTLSYQKLVKFRHQLPENVNRYFKKIGATKVSLDFAVPENVFPELFTFYQNRRAANPMLETVLFGHIGENHLHFNFFPQNEAEKEKVSQLYEAAARFVIQRGGTISAEHGIGKLKHRYLTLMFGQKGIAEMVAVKKSLDPACILGLDNIFPASLLYS